MKFYLINDNWDDLGKIYTLCEYLRTPESTGVRIVFIDEAGETHARSVACHQIEWISE